MGAVRKITVQLPENLLHRAQKATGQGLTATLREGLQLVAASKVYDELRRWRGRYTFSIDLKKLREDRR